MDLLPEDREDDPVLLDFDLPESLLESLLEELPLLDDPLDRLELPELLLPLLERVVPELDREPELRELP